MSEIKLLNCAEMFAQLEQQMALPTQGRFVVQSISVDGGATTREINLLDSAEVLAYLKQHMALANSYTRLPTLLLFALYCDGNDWLRELGEAWPVCDNIGIYADDLVEVVSEHHCGDYPIKAMMNAQGNPPLNRCSEK